MKKLLPLMGILIIVALGAIVFWTQKGSLSTSTILPTPIPVQSQKEYKLTDISSHSSSSDCWIAIDGGVYDVTKYISSHPGGAQILKGCGIDASTLFHNRPDREPDHSAEAVSVLSHFKIGTLVL